MTIPMKAPQQPPPQTIEDVITKGDLSKLTPEQRTEFYIKLCNRHGLDPLTQPLDWLMLNGRLTLYANRRCADQLRKIHAININIVSQEYSDGLLTIHVKAKDGTGREDEDLGVVAIPDTLKGEARANTILKCVTKAKRRVTLSISGLGFLDETEVEDIPAKAKGEVIPAIEPPTPAAAAPEHSQGIMQVGENVQQPLTDDQKEQIKLHATELSSDRLKKFLAWLNVKSLDDIGAHQYDRAISGLQKAVGGSVGGDRSAGVSGQKPEAVSQG